MPGMEIEQHHVDEFIAEAREHLLDIEDHFLALESAKSSRDPRLVDEVFRAVHSVKGGAAFLGLTAIGELAHAMESLLGRMRDGIVQPDSESIDALLKGVDLLNVLLGDPEGGDPAEISEVMGFLKRLTPKHSEAAPPPPAGPALAGAGDADSSLELDALDLEALHRDYDFIYLLRYDFSAPGCPDPAGVLAELAQAGLVADAVLSLPPGGLEKALDGPLAMDIAFASLVGPDYIEEVAGLPEKSIFLVDELRVEDPEPEQAPPPAKPTPTPDADRVRPGERSGTVRINVDILDRLMTLAGEMVLVRNQQLMVMDRTDPARRAIIQRLDVVTTELQETVMRTRMQPIGNAFSKLPRIVRDLSNKLGKRIEIKLTGGDVELDKTILESLYDPLTHIIRNCCDHGVEPPAQREAAGKTPKGRVDVRAYHEGGQINIEFRDDGRGIDPDVVKDRALEKGLRTVTELDAMGRKDILNLVTLPGFSTAKTVSDVSGRGVGMDVVRHAIEDLGGSLELESWPGQGTSIQLRLPLTLAIIPCLIVVVQGRRYAVPQVNVDELVCLYDRDVYTRIEVAGNQEVFRLRERLLPMVRLNEILARPAPFTSQVKGEVAEAHRAHNKEFLAQEANILAQGDEVPADMAGTLNFAVVKVGGERFGLIVDKVLGTEEIVVKPMHASLKPLKCYSGATVMGDGSVAMILDIEGIARHARVFLGDQSEEQAASGPRPAHDDTQSLLLFKSGESELFALALPLIRRIEKISMAEVESVGDKEFITIDGQSTRVLRLDAYLSVGPVREEHEMFLILPKYAKRPFGLLMNEIVDIEDTPVDLNTGSYSEDGLLGTDIVRGHLTLFPDIYRLIEMAEPKWFAGRMELNRERQGEVRVLVAEDSAFMREMIKTYLEGDGYAVTDVEDGKQALDVLAREKFDILVSDIEMPVLNGLDLIRELRISTRNRNIPAMALTSLDSPADRKKALDNGFDEYQIKVDRERFLTAAARLVASGRKLQVVSGDAI